MELFVANKSATVWNISPNLDTKKVINISVCPKAASINHYDGNTFGILDQYDVLRVYSLSNDKKFEIPLNTKTNTFLFDLHGAILTGDSLGRVHRYKTGISRSKCIAGPVENNEIISIKASFDTSLLFCHYQSGIISYYDAHTHDTNKLKYEKDVSVFDVSKWRPKVTLLGARCGDVVCYDIEKNEIIRHWQEHTASIVGAAFSIYNKHLALSVSQDRKAVLLGLDNKSIIQTFAHENVPTTCAFNDNFQFAIGDETGGVSIFDIRTKHRLLELKTDSRVMFLDFYYTNQEKQSMSKSNVLKETQNTTNYSSVLSKSNISKESLISTEYAKDSQKIAMSKNTPNKADKSNISSNSLFSGDGSVDTKDPARNSDFDLSTANVSRKTLKQVKFRDNVKDSETLPTKLIDGTEINVKMVSKLIPETDTVGADAEPSIVIPKVDQQVDYSTLRLVIIEELQKHLNAFESRIKNDVIFGVVDQLTITENNIVSPLMALVDQNRLLNDENALLRQELRKYKYNT